MDLTGTWRAAVADEDLRRSWQDDGFDDAAWEPIDGPRALAVRARVRRRRRPAALPPHFDADGPGRGTPGLADLRRDLLPGRRVARRRLPRRHRGLLRPAHLRGHRRAARARPSTTSRVEVTCTPADRPDRQAQHHRRLPALGLPRPRLEPRRHLAPGARRPRPGPVRIARLRVAVPGGRRRSARCSCSGPRSTATRPRTVTPAHHRSATLDHARPTSRSPTGANEVEWTVTVDRPGPVVAPRPRRPAPPRPARPGAARRRRGRHARPTSAGCAPACARCACGRGSRQVNGERLFLKGSNHGPTRMALAEATAGRAAPRRRAGPRGRARPPPRPRPHHPPRALRRGRRGGAAALAGLPAAVGLRPRHPQAGRAPGRGGGRPARPPPVDRHLVRAQRADGHRDRPGDVGRPARRSRRMAVQGRRGPGAADLEQDRARPLGEARPREGRRHAPGHRPLGRAPPPAPARRHRQPPLLRLVPRRRARPARLPAGRAPHGPLRHRVRRPGRARRPPTFCEPERWPDLDWERLGRTHALQKAVFDRHVPPADHADLRRLAAGHPGVPGHASCGSTSRRCAASSTGPPAGSPSSASPTGTRRSPGRCSTTTGRRSSAYDALRDACRPVIVVADRLPETRARPATRWRSTSTSSATSARRSTTPRSPPTLALGRRRAHVALARATSRPTPASGSAPCSSSCPTTPGAARRSTSAAATATERGRQPRTGTTITPLIAPFSDVLQARTSVPDQAIAQARWRLIERWRRRWTARRPSPVHPKPKRPGAVAGGVLPVGRRQEVGDGDHRASCSWASSSPT